MENLRDVEWLENLPKLVAQLRKKSGLNQSGFARACKVSRSYISLLELGRRLPSMAVLRRILAYGKKVARK